MKPIEFACHATLQQRPEEIAGQILDLAKWPEFDGCWPIPGIKSASFDVRTPEVVGTRIRVVNGDGSSHVEVIVAWEPQRRVQLRMQDFSPPLSRLASEFEETWDFQQVGGETHIVRSFRLHAKTRASRWLLRIIAYFLKRAIRRHLRRMAP